MTWRMAESLNVLLAEVNKAAPGRSKVSDGGIGDAAHASRSSDHNPWVKKNGVGVVRARDFTHDPKGGMDASVLALQLAGLLYSHPAMGTGAYVIWNRRIISADRLKEGWRPYSGSNPHDKHVHVSVGLTGYDLRTPWDVLVKPRKKPADPNQKSRQRLLEDEKRHRRLGRVRLAEHLKRLRISLRPKKK